MTVKGLKTQTLQTADNVSGLVLLNTTSFSAVASQSINDVFNATYDTYQIVTDLSASSNNGETVLMRLRVAGADNTSNNYRYGQYFIGAYDSIAAGNNNNTATTSFQIGGSSSTYLMYSALQDIKRFLKVQEHQLLGGEIVISPTGYGSGALKNGHTGVYVGGNSIMSNDSSTGLLATNYTIISWRDRYVIKGRFPMEFYRIL